jgi:hypothetical protein
LDFKEPIPYRQAYRTGSRAKVADRDVLEAFKLEWKYHHKLVPEQLECAGRVATVKGVAFYHGGDPVYKLEGIPGLWHEQCLRPA